MLKSIQGIHDVLIESLIPTIHFSIEELNPWGNRMYKAESGKVADPNHLAGWKLYALKIEE